MKNSEWFFLAVCAKCFIAGCGCIASVWLFALSEGEELSLITIGLILIFFAFGYFIFELHTPFKNWLDSL